LLASEARRVFLGDTMIPTMLTFGRAAGVNAQLWAGPPDQASDPRRAHFLPNSNFPPPGPASRRTFLLATMGDDTMPTPPRTKPQVRHDDLARNHEWDADRFAYLATFLYRGRQTEAAKLAERWAKHHVQVARQLRTQVGA
jgi:hypothetical protein